MPIDKVYISPAKQITQFTFGYSDVVASLLWVRLMQDIDVCDQSDETVSLPAFDPDEKDKLKEILERDLPASKCDRGWVYHMLDLITDLAPDFYGAYLEGATMLSVVVDDRSGASLLFDKSRGYFPEDWNLLYRAAYHEMFEMQNPDKAADLMRRAGERGAPKWVYALSSKIYTKLGQALLAKGVLEAVVRTNPQSTPSMDRVRMELQRVNQILNNAQ